jgi:hypothetical protein
MATRTFGATAERQTYLAIAGLAGVWLVAALFRTETTFHLGPVILPLIPLLIAPKGSRTKAVGVALGVGAGVITFLSLTGNLSGPAFEPFSSAVAESVLTLIGSGVLALGLARLTR